LVELPRLKFSSSLSFSISHSTRINKRVQRVYIGRLSQDSPSCLSTLLHSGNESGTINNTQQRLGTVITLRLTRDQPRR
jgi:hypothetical protein